MRWLRAWRVRLRSLVFRRKVDEELNAELAFYVEERAERHRRAGMAPADARRAAERSVGSMTYLKEECRNARGFRWLEDVCQDTRYAGRALRRSPAFTVVAVVTLGLGIGANTAMFTFVDNVLLKPLPYPEADRIVQVMQKRPNGDPFAITTLDFLDWQRLSTVFEFVAAQRAWAPALTGKGEPVQLRGARVSASYYQVSRVQPMLGRTFRPDEDEYGHDHVVVLSHELWSTRFGADASIVNRAILLDGDPYTVVGVMPPGSVFDRTTFQIAKPIGFAPFEMTRGLHWLNGLGRLKPGVTLERARAEMDGLAAQFATEYPFTNNGFGVSIEPYEGVLVGAQLRSSFYVLLAAAAMVLLIGCVNLANLVLARGLARDREIAVRASLGAGRARLVRQLLTENLVLALFGGGLGVGLAFATLQGLKAAMPAYSLPPEANVQIDARVLLFALAISVATGLLCGLLPAVSLTKTHLAGALKDGARTSASGRLRRTLVVAEVALAFVLLAGAGLLLRSLFALQRVNLGFEATTVLTIGLPTPAAQYPDLTRLTAYLREVQRVVEQVSGVRETALSGGLPLRGGTYRLPMQLAGTTPVPRPRRSLYVLKVVTPSYFHLFGISLRSGRLLSPDDRNGAPRVALVNERLAKRLFPAGNAVGKQMLVPQILPGRPDLGDDVPHEIVGVISDEKLYALNDAVTEVVYTTLDQNPFYNPQLSVRAAVNPESLPRAIRAAVDTVNPNQVFSDVKTMASIKEESVVGERFQTMLLTGFSSLALALAAVGIYGVMAYAVVQRTREMGIRAALGANARNLRRLVLRSSLGLTSLGLAIGLVGALALTRVLETFLFGVGARDPITLAAVALTLLCVSLVACYLPARRATRVDPLVALRCE